MSVSESLPLRETPVVPGPPLLGSLLPMARDPARFFAACYRKYGPVFRINIFGNGYKVLAGPEAAHFMGTREGKDSLRSKEFWSPARTASRTRSCATSCATATRRSPSAAATTS
jgi:hypothetical protein